MSVCMCVYETVALYCTLVVVLVHHHSVQLQFNVYFFYSLSPRLAWLVNCECDIRHYFLFVLFGIRIWFSKM